MTTLNKEHSELRERLFKRLKTDDKADTYVIPFRVMDVLVDEIIDLIQTSNKEIEKAYGSCHKCYGKGCATTIDYSSGGGMTTKNPVIRYCSCERGKQLEKLNELSNKEARIDEINLFREAMINHSTPMIYAPDRIKQLKQEEAK